MKKSISLLAATAAFVLTSCGGGITDTLSIMTPVGAPSIAFYKYANSNNWEPQDQPTNIAKAFTTAEKDVLVFDSINGLKQIAGPNKAPYKLAKVITNGNLYMVSLKGKEASDEIPADAKIVSFGEGLTPDSAIKFLYPELVDQISYVNGAPDAASIVCSGLHEGSAVDYVIGAQPSIWGMMNKPDCATKGKVKIVKNIQADMETKTGLKGIPQAGIFIKNDTYEAKKDDVKSFLKTIGDSIKIVKNDPEFVYNELLKTLSDADIKQKFGFTKATLMASFSGDSNLVGLTDGGVDINAFLTQLGMNTFADDAFLEIYK